jgi:hypothetical protein
MSRDPDAPPDDRRFPRRATDRVEDAVAWLLAVAALVLLVVAALTGTAVHGRNAESARMVTQARAVLLEDAELVSAGDPSVRLPVLVEARWTDRSGTAHSGEIFVRKPAEAGTEVDVWLRADGKVSTRPLDRGHAVTAGVVAAVVVVLGGGGVLGAVWWGVRCLTAVCNARRWEREWARVGPEWSGRRL